MKDAIGRVVKPGDFCAVAILGRQHPAIICGVDPHIEVFILRHGPKGWIPWGSGDTIPDDEIYRIVVVPDGTFSQEIEEILTN